MELVQLIKKTAMDAFRASKPTDIVFGEVISINPLKVRVDQKKVLDEDFLIPSGLWKKQTFTVKTSDVSGHVHTVTVELDNTLKIGDKVTMIMAAGGQKYAVIDRKVMA